MSPPQEQQALVINRPERPVHGVDSDMSKSLYSVWCRWDRATDHIWAFHLSINVQIKNEFSKKMNKIKSDIK